jgi:hypothetical protein
MSPAPLYAAPPITAPRRRLAQGICVLPFCLICNMGPHSFSGQVPHATRFINLVSRRCRETPPWLSRRLSHAGFPSSAPHQIAAGERPVRQTYCSQICRTLSRDSAIVGECSDAPPPVLRALRLVVAAVPGWVQPPLTALVADLPCVGIAKRRRNRFTAAAVARYWFAVFAR